MKPIHFVQVVWICLIVTTLNSQFDWKLQNPYSFYNTEWDIFSYKVQNRCVEGGEKYVVTLKINNDDIFGAYIVNGTIMENGDSIKLYFEAGEDWNVCIEELNKTLDLRDNDCNFELSGQSPEICITELALDTILFSGNDHTNKYVAKLFLKGSTGNYWVNEFACNGIVYESDSIQCANDYSFYVADDIGGKLIVNGIAPCTAKSDNEMHFISKFNIFPNPASDFIFIECLDERMVTESIKFKLVNMNGRIVKQNPNLQLSQGKLRIWLTNLPKGIYYLHLISPEFMVQKTIIKSN